MVGQKNDISKTIIPEDEISMIGYSFDEHGKVFLWQNRLFRYIYPESKETVQKLLSSGLIDELMRENLFPKTEVAPYTLGECDLILEHEKIHPTIYPSNWSFDMLKDAALCILKVNKIARKYGYETMDSHGYNVLFKEGRPLYIDLGSFVKNDENPNGWRGYDEFIRSICYPIYVFKSGNTFLGRAILLQIKKTATVENYYKFRFPLLSWTNSFFRRAIINGLYRRKNIISALISAVIVKFEQKIEYHFPKLKSMRQPKKLNINFDELIQSIEKVDFPISQTMWGDYHDKVFKDSKEIIPITPRFSRILEIIDELNPSSVIEIAGNQGMFAELILKNTPVKQVTCTDYDEQAVNNMYNRVKDKGLNIAPSLLDITAPVDVKYGMSIESRYRSELLVAMALTHHLVLSQKVPLENIFKQFTKFSGKYVLTEFMPLGLYGGNVSTSPVPPKWYNEEWFENEFKKHYKILYKEELEINRTLFVGEIIKQK